jgi:hypothetical protein
LREKAKPLCVRCEKVRSALKWLKENNPLYVDIEINNDLLDSLDENHILPYHIEHIVPSNTVETLVSRYDEDVNFDMELVPPEISANNNEIPFQNVVITDIDGHVPPHELRAAALRHVKQGGGYIQILHDPTPVNEFCNPSLFPMIYPTLFPYGVGGFEDKTHCRIPISMKRHVKHLCSLADRRFQEHYSFMFTAFNILQRQAVLLVIYTQVSRFGRPTLVQLLLILHLYHQKQYISSLSEYLEVILLWPILLRNEKC